MANLALLVLLARAAYLELYLGVLGQVGEVDASAEEDGCGLGDPVDLPAQVLKEG